MKKAVMIVKHRTTPKVAAIVRHNTQTSRKGKELASEPIPDNLSNADLLMGPGRSQHPELSHVLQSWDKSSFGQALNSQRAARTVPPFSLPALHDGIDTIQFSSTGPFQNRFHIYANHLGNMHPRVVLLAKNNRLLANMFERCA